MKVLLISATEYELHITHRELKHTGAGDRTDLLICGIGIASTTYHLTKSLLQNKYDLVIQAGIAGTFTNDLHPGEVVLIGEDTFADTGIEENGLFNDLFTSGLADRNTYPFTNGWLINKHEVLHNSSLKTVKAITVARITDDKKQIDRQRAIYNAEVESMEGAALHYVCLQLNIPFFQMRSISNRVGERDKNKWKMKEATDSLNTELLIKLSSLFNNN